IRQVRCVAGRPPSGNGMADPQLGGELSLSISSPCAGIVFAIRYCVVLAMQETLVVGLGALPSNRPTTPAVTRSSPASCAVAAWQPVLLPQPVCMLSIASTRVGASQTLGPLSNSEGSRVPGQPPRVVPAATSARAASDARKKLVLRRGRGDDMSSFPTGM